MSEIKSAAVIGGGALGLLYAEALSTVENLDLYFAADGNRYEKLKSSEFEINGKKKVFSVKNPMAEETAPADFVLVAVKNHHLEAAAPLIKKSAGKGTVIISVLNGIDSEHFIQKLVPEAEVLYCVAIGMDAVKEGTVLRYTAQGKLLLGTGDSRKDSPVIASLRRLLDSAGLKNEVPEDIQKSIWYKWMINIGVNQVSAVNGGKYHIFQNEKSAQEIMDSAMTETVNVAKAAGVNMSEKDVSDWYPVLNTLGPQGKTSMLQDMESRRKTEVEYFSGRLIELAEQYGIEVPANRTLFRLIRAMEKASGLN